MPALPGRMLVQLALSSTHTAIDDVKPIGVSTRQGTAETRMSAEDIRLDSIDVPLRSIGSLWFTPLNAGGLPQGGRRDLR
jgi:hypothetical protein